MTKPSPRIYTYKITFEEVPYYYYGVHKEKRFDEPYMGSPVTNKWCWELYTPKKYILEFFDYSDIGWSKAQEIEKQLIKPFYNSDKWCLNESCGWKISSDSCKLGGQRAYEMKVGLHSLTKEQKSEVGKKGGNAAYKLKSGIHSRSEEEKIQHNIKAGKRAFELKTGIHCQTKEEKIQCGRRTYELGVGVHALTSEERRELGKIGGLKASSQVWKCTITGYETNAGALSIFQRNRGIDTKNRIKIK
jgi:hypothetical protein